MPLSPLMKERLLRIIRSGEVNDRLFVNGKANASWSCCRELASKIFPRQGPEQLKARTIFVSGYINSKKEKIKALIQTTNSASCDVHSDVNPAHNQTEDRFTDVSGLNPCEQEKPEIEGENGDKPVADKILPVEGETFKYEYMILDDSSQNRLMAVTNDTTHARIVTLYSELAELERQRHEQRMAIQRAQDILDNLLIKRKQKEEELQDLQKWLQ